ncbi:MAG: ribosome small subunit-dependent GTPase A [Eubacteriaceae bacterium]|nr:ribosome small subunit-dependent GTPase A [Eubacteriaceae bacterium]
MKGRIIKGVGSFYDIMDEDKNITRTQAKGVFRNRKITPMVGDMVDFISDEDGSRITNIYPRTSELSRPPVANATAGVIVCSVKNPDLAPVLLDKMLVNNQKSGLETTICFNKCDLADEEFLGKLRDDYKDCGAELIFVSAANDSLENIKELIRGHITVFSGVSGAGKSTILSKVSGKELQVGGISEKSKRGKHTTRHVELIDVGEDFILDTPGFSDLEISDMAPEELWRYYPEFRNHSDCKFSTCLHLKEPDCNVKNAVKEGLISKLRYKNYRYLYEELLKTYKKY